MENSRLGLFEFTGSTKRNRRQEAIFEDQDQRQRFVENNERERRRRAERARETTAALRIQSTVRSFLNRQRARAVIRADFDLNKEKDFDRQLSRVIFFYTPPLDNARLASMCTLALNEKRRERGEVMNGHRRHALFARIIKAMLHSSTSDQLALAPLIRCVEEFAVDCVDALYLSRNGYFNAMLNRIGITLPCDILDVNLAISKKAEGMLDALVLPLRICTGETMESREIWQWFCSEALSSRKWSLHVVCLVVPYLKQQIGNDRMSFHFFLETMAGCLESDRMERCPLLTYAILQLASVQTRSMEVDPECLELALATFPYTECSMSSGSMEVETSSALLRVLGSLCSKLYDHKSTLSENTGTDEESDDESETKMMVDSTVGSDDWCMGECLRLVDSIAVRNRLLEAVRWSNAPKKTLSWFAMVVQFALRSPSIGDGLLYPLSFDGNVIRSLWSQSQHQSSTSIFGQRHGLLDKLKCGTGLNDEEQWQLIPLFLCFSALLCNNLKGTDDSDFAVNGPSIVAFSLEELIDVTRQLRDALLGLIELAFPESRFRSRDQPMKHDAHTWKPLFLRLVRLVQIIHQRDSRLKFLPVNFWSSHNRSLVINRQVFSSAGTSALRRKQERPFAFVRFLTHDDLAEETNTVLPSAVDLRNITIMRSIPFVVPFIDRLKMFAEMLMQDREDDNAPNRDGERRGMHVVVRRTQLYEDAFDRLSPINAPDLRVHIRVSMINQAGVGEAGVDGGGIFRDFLSELLKSAFDPERGLFTTTHDQLLYPNPIAMQIYPDNYRDHFYFLGRIVGKLISEGLLAELQFAEFFLVQWLREAGADIVDLHHMASYDPLLYRNLLYLKNCAPGLVATLDLDFTVIVEELGVTRMVELKPRGRECAVTAENRLEYLSLFVNFFLHKRIQEAVEAMRAGINNLIHLDWLSIFSADELQSVIAGSQSDIDVDNMRRHTTIHHIQDEWDQRYVDVFWEVVAGLSAADKHKLLKFITGCSRPPLMGFKDLYPGLAVQLVQDSERLPTASTCMNLLKLPRFRDTATLRQKLIFAIEADAGFELS